ncbi:MAG: hypothetical protein JNL95_00640 [Chitinophagales bacterium]|nr:hypothetical protein [Chitinophagales bacterium]
MANNPNISHSVTMTVAQITAVKSALETIQNNMPFLHRLSAVERSMLHPISTATRIFTENTIHVLVNNPDVQPEGYNAPEKQKAMALYHQLEDLRIAVNLLAKRISDTQLLVGNETYLAALEGYRHIENVDKIELSDVDAIYYLLQASYRWQDELELENASVFDAYLGTW